MPHNSNNPTPTIYRRLIPLQCSPESRDRHIRPVFYLYGSECISVGVATHATRWRCKSACPCFQLNQSLWQSTLQLPRSIAAPEEYPATHGSSPSKETAGNFSHSLLLCTTAAKP